TSPHLVHPGERMRVDGKAADAGWVGMVVDRHRADIEAVGASYFEVTVALSLARFRESRVDASVVEVGLGGRLDATNVLTPEVCVITRVALDHTQILGNSVAGIASEKAGIIKSGTTVVAGHQDPEAIAVIRQVCLSLGVRLQETGVDSSWQGHTLVTPKTKYSRLFPALEGSHQLGNAATAVLASAAFLTRTGRPTSAAAVRSGLRHVRRLAGLRARYEVWSEDPLVVLDVAHNPDALLPLLDRFSADSRAGSGRRRILIGMMEDKDHLPVFTRLRDLGFVVSPFVLSGPRALPAERILAGISRARWDSGSEKTVGVDLIDDAPPLEAKDLDNFVSGLDSRDSLLVTGSHQVIGEFLARLDPPNLVMSGR
ncbi:MAG: dihydrofolate synthase/folylpolyglutamate synthase, partial [Thalassolituus oleivorans]